MHPAQQAAGEDGHGCLAEEVVRQSSKRARRLREFHNFTLKSKHVSRLRVPEHEIIGMNPRMASTDHSPDSPIGANSHRECRTWQMDDNGDDQETVLADAKEARIGSWSCRPRWSST